ncbi:DUF6446 family protein [Pseudooceanicola nitratireducens]|uniref:DUF6446 family protein n=1 Tax=Pseudooceanicola nitratireducens TaxID=517719 RepID=UPI0023F54AE0|nr:DUF6446 family protein [Pseudooceanicola nitratireducens]
MGKFLAALIVICAVGGGGLLYYLQVYGYYETIVPTGEDVILTDLTGAEDLVTYADFQAIDAYSSPIRYRACFTTDVTGGALDSYQPYPDAEPLEAPGWFDCYDADEIGAALEDGRARAVLSVKNYVYGIDRVAAIFPDGRGYVWHQINHCGEVVFDGRPAPEGCPQPPSEN